MTPGHDIHLRCVPLFGNSRRTQCALSLSRIIAHIHDPRPELSWRVNSCHPVSNSVGPSLEPAVTTLAMTTLTRSGGPDTGLVGIARSFHALPPKAERRSPGCAARHGRQGCDRSQRNTVIS